MERELLLRNASLGTDKAAVLMASATPTTRVPDGSTSLTEDRGVGGRHPCFWVAKPGQRGDGVFGWSKPEKPLHIFWPN